MIEILLIFIRYVGTSITESFRHRFIEGATFESHRPHEQIERFNMELPLKLLLPRLNLSVDLIHNYGHG